MLKNVKNDNSTNRLLNLIRTGDHGELNDADLNVPDSSFSRKIKNKHLNLGVFITRQDLTLALTSDKGWTKKKGLIKWHHVPIPEHILPESDEFSSLLGGTLDAFLGKRKNISIWCSLDTSSLKIRNITIPDVPQSKIANAAFWGMKRETEFDENKEIFNFEILGDLSIDGIKKKSILVFSADRDKIHALEMTFKKVGYFLSGITFIPFAMQNFIRTGQIQVDDPYFAIVNITWENTEICCFSQSGILLVRILRIGSRNLTEELDCPLGMDPIDHLSLMTDTDGGSRIRDTTDRLISKIVRTGDYCAQKFTGNSPLKQYLFYGETDYCQPFMNHVSATIPTVVNTLEPIRDNLLASEEAELPPNAQKRNFVLTAFGIGLSSNDITPNFLFTFVDQQKAKKQKKINLAIVLTGMVFLAVCFFVHSVLNFTQQKHLTVLAQLIQQEKKFRNEIQTEAITENIAGAVVKDLNQKQYVRQYLPLAVISDVCHFTPEHIHLSSMVFNLKRDKKKQDNVSRKLFIQGQVSGHTYGLYSELYNYLLKLSDSPVFGDVEITDKRIKQNNHDKKLIFKATLEVL